jgi:pilus assembly protein CpaC
VLLTAGRSLVMTSPFEITRIAVTNPAVADATVVAPTEILIDGKAAGTVSLIVWGQGQRAQYDIVVDRGVSSLQQQLNLIFPGEDLQASQTDDAVILTGHASTNAVMLKAGEIAEAIAPKAKVLNLLQLPGGMDSQQVLLQVRVAEVNRRAVSELGASLFTGGTGVKQLVARGTTEQFAAPEFSGLSRTDDNGVITSSGTLTFNDFLNLFMFSNKYNFGTVIHALQTSGNLQSLAEPNLIAYNNQEASFLAGGELPIPVVSGNTGNVSVTYKEFGIRLTFRPTIAGDVIRLKVEPEVSSLDFANGITISGFRIPALIVRRASTDVELRDGQSFAIAGLMNNSSQDTRESVPLLSKVPILGAFFKSKATTKEQTELMVLVTPRLVRALNPDEVPPLPTMDNKFLPPGGASGASGSPPASTPGNTR